MYNNIKIIADMTESCIFNSETEKMVPYSKLFLHYKLEQDLKAWNEVWNKAELWKEENRKKFDYESFNKKGKVLRQRLQNFLGDYIKVEFIEEQITD